MFNKRKLKLIMKIVIIQTLMAYLNCIGVIWSYESKNYLVAIISAFATGVCFRGLLNSIF